MLLQKWAPGFFSHFPAQSPLHTKKSPDTLLSISLFFLAVLGLRCFFQAFSSCGQQELLPGCGARAFHRSVFPCCGAWALLGAEHGGLECKGFGSCAVGIL